MNIEHWACKELVGKFVKEPNWPKEIKIAKKLLFNYSPDLDAWLALNMSYKLTSLAFFLTENGKSFIPQSQNNPYLFDLTVDIK